MTARATVDGRPKAWDESKGARVEDVPPIELPRLVERWTFLANEHRLCGRTTGEVFAAEHDGIASGYSNAASDLREAMATISTAPTCSRCGEAKSDDGPDVLSFCFDCWAGVQANAASEALRKAADRIDAAANELDGREDGARFRIADYIASDGSASALAWAARVRGMK